jgi:hypothetical protein
MPDHETINPDTVTVYTVVPYTEGPEYRKYELDPEPATWFIQDIQSPKIGEMVLNVEVDTDD